jgi:hypothetical protein
LEQKKPVKKGSWLRNEQIVAGTVRELRRTDSRCNVVSIGKCLHHLEVEYAEEYATNARS